MSLFYLHQRRPNADWLTIPILIEYNKQRLHHEFAFSLCFLCFFWYTNKCRTRSSSALQRQFVTPPSRSLVFTFLSIFNWTQSLRPDHTHLRTYRDTSQLGLLLQIVCPPVCISRLHTYSISLFGYLLAMMKTDISRIRSNSIPLLALGINITAIPVSLESLLTTTAVYISFLFLLLYIFIYISLPVLWFPIYLLCKPAFDPRTAPSSGLRLSNVRARLRKLK